MAKGKLYLIPNVIAEDSTKVIPSHVQEVLQSLNYFLVENLRTARRYISSLKLGITIEDLDFQVLDKKTSEIAIDKFMQPIKQGINIGILSESGCPGVADPGAKAVEWAQKNNFEVVPLVGPSSLLLALMGSGFNGQKFSFHGYLPIDKKDLESTIKKLEAESLKYGQTQIFIETPFRNNQLLKALVSVLHHDTQLCIAKDLTGKDQFLKTKSIKEWKNQLPELHKVPCVFLIYAGK